MLRRQDFKLATSIGLVKIMATEEVAEKASMVGERVVAEVATVITLETKSLNKHSKSEKACSQITFSIIEDMGRQPADTTLTSKATHLGATTRMKKWLVRHHSSAGAHQRSRNEAEAEECTQVASFLRLLWGCVLPASTRCARHVNSSAENVAYTSAVTARSNARAASHSCAKEAALATARVQTAFDAN